MDDGLQANAERAAVLGGDQHSLVSIRREVFSEMLSSSVLFRIGIFIGVHAGLLAGVLALF